MMQAMPRLVLSALTVLVVAGVAAWDPPAAAQNPSPRIVAIGDVHGAADNLVRILQAAGLIDTAQRWSGGTARLIQNGDFTDRGQDVRKVIDLLMRLEGEAKRAGGRVDVLFGNHEGMNVLHDLRDVSANAYATFADERSAERRRRAWETHDGIARRAGAMLNRDTWMVAHPPGYVEYLEAFGPTGRYGRWIRQRKAILQVGDTIFMHAGLTPDTTPALEEINRSIEKSVRDWDSLVAALERQRLAASSFTLQEIVDAAQVEIGRISLALKKQEQLDDYVTREYVALLQQMPELPKSPLIAADGPLWYRGLAQLPEDNSPQIEALLARYGAQRFVIGHTPQLPGRIALRFGGRVVAIDTGMLTSFYKGGRPSALEIQDGRLTAIYPDGREPLSPATSSGSRASAAPMPMFAAAKAH